MSHTLHHCVSWCWRIFRYVTSCGFNRYVVLSFMVFSVLLLLFIILLIRHFFNWISFGEFTLPDVCTYLINRFLEVHQCCRGSGGPYSAQLRLWESWENLFGSGLPRFVLRSNRSEPGARQLVCWWWFSLFSPSATYQSACSMSWKGNHSSAAASMIKSLLRGINNRHCDKPGFMFLFPFYHELNLSVLCSLVMHYKALNYC